MPTRTLTGCIKSAPLDSQVFNPATGELGPVCANAPIVDRLGDIVELRAWKSGLPAFLKLGAMLLFHDTRRPIGRWTDAQIRSDGLYLTGRIGRGFPDGDDARAMVGDGVLHACSVGFNPIDGYRDKSGVWHYTDVTLLECSLVSLPANQDALFSVDSAGVLKSIELVSEDGPAKRPTVKALQRQLASVLVAIAERESARAGRRHDVALRALRERVRHLKAAMVRQGLA